MRMAHINRVCVSALSVACLIWPASAACGETDVPAAVRDAVRALSADRHGETAFHRHFESDQRAPGHNGTLVVESARLRADGKVVAIRLYRRTVNGAAASEQDLGKQQAEADKNLDDDYTLPVLEDALSEYRFGTPVAHCDGCDEGVVEVPFTSRKRDDGHGDGTIRIDERSHHFLTLTFHPSVLPKQADSGSITVTFGRALADLWDVVRVTEHYSGHLLFIHGTYDTVATQSGYRRFESNEAGRKALAAGV
jgi:hypothetical protein